MSWSIDYHSMQVQHMLQKTNQPNQNNPHNQYDQHNQHNQHNQNSAPQSNMIIRDSDEKSSKEIVKACTGCHNLLCIIGCMCCILSL